jgi:hypothetical protein
LTPSNSINHELFFGDFIVFFIFNSNLNLKNPNSFYQLVPLPHRSGKNGYRGYRCSNGWYKKSCPSWLLLLIVSAHRCHLLPQCATCAYHNVFGEEEEIKKTNISKMLLFVLKKVNLFYSYEVKRKY